jgi:hypothetical protein
MRASLFGFLVMLLLGGCRLPASDSSLPAPIDQPIDQEGTLVLRLRTGSASLQTLAPTISMKFVSFDIQVTGPNQSFTIPGHTGGTLQLDDLSFGSWTIAVDARNEEKTLIGQGQTTVAITPEQPSASAEILILPLKGTGTLQLTASWTGAARPKASAICSLVSMSGTDLAPHFEMSPHDATYNNAAIEAGYYLLTIQLYDNSVLFWGTAEAVRIVAGQTTTGSWTATN